jgi:hypothetical protein
VPYEERSYQQLLAKGFCKQEIDTALYKFVMARLCSPHGAYAKPRPSQQAAQVSAAPRYDGKENINQEMLKPRLHRAVGQEVQHDGMKNHFVIRFFRKIMSAKPLTSKALSLLNTVREETEEPGVETKLIRENEQ